MKAWDMRFIYSYPMLFILYGILLNEPSVVCLYGIFTVIVKRTVDVASVTGSVASVTPVAAKIGSFIKIIVDKGNLSAGKIHIIFIVITQCRR